MGEEAESELNGAETFGPLPEDEEPTDEELDDIEHEMEDEEAGDPQTSVWDDWDDDDEWDDEDDV
jgi:hypothetical protein